LSYLEQLFSRLRKHKLVKGVRGPGGGYQLARPSSKISIADIIEAVDEKMDLTQCQGKGNCNQGKQCLTHKLWDGLTRNLHRFLSDITLDQYVNRPHLIEKVKKQDVQYGRFLNRKSAA
jgi:Rrf2 family iron-sulfur cluster assembly transcriptional regulator